jgi:hypothetical protein
MGDAAAYRVRRDEIDPSGRVTLRYKGMLHHTGVAVLPLATSEITLASSVAASREPAAGFGLLPGALIVLVV